MKYIFSQMAFFMAQESNKRNLRFMMRFALLVLALIVVYSALFHVIMIMEKRDYSAITGLYWTLTVMSTLGFGDITFESDLGKLFSIVVLLSGVLLFMLVMPFTFIRFVYAPWLEAHTQAVVPTKLPDETKGHVIVAGVDSIAASVVERLRQYSIPYVQLVPDHALALALYDKRYSVMLGDLDSAQTYTQARVDRASLVVALFDDLKNTNIAATVREISSTVPLAGSVDHEDSLDILRLAGCNYTYHFARMLGKSLARRVFDSSMRSNIIWRFEHLCIAEAPAQNTPYVGKVLKETDLRGAFGLTVVGIWHGKEYKPALPDALIEAGSVLLLAGTENFLERFDTHLARSNGAAENSVLILGGGRVGLAVADALEARKIPFRLVEKSPGRIPRDDPRFITGSAADLEVLRKAGIETIQTVIVTTHNDDLNIYLTIYCRKLRPDIQIISRATLDRNVASLYNAGANLVMSHATLAANTVTNLLRPGRIFMLTEGLNIFRVKAPAALHGVSLIDSNLRRETECNVVAVHSEAGMHIHPDPALPINASDELILIGTVEAERAFMDRYHQS